MRALSVHRWFLFVVAVLLPGARGFGAEAPPSQLKLSVARVVVFKDGYCLVSKSGGAVADDRGRVFTDQVPDGAVLGTFWATADAAPGDGARLLAMRAQWMDDGRDFQEETPAVTIVELLRANIGQKVTLGLADKTDKGEHLTVSGTLREVLDLPAIPAEPLALTTAGTTSREIVPRDGNLVVVEGDAGRAVVEVSSIQTITGPQLATKITRHEQTLTRSKRLSFDFGRAAAGKAVALKLYYFTPGLGWAPTYRVSCKSDDKAELALQADVSNDLEDISDAALDLVVGVPSFRFKDTPSALCLETVLRAYTNNQIVLLQSNFSNARQQVLGSPWPPQDAAVAGEQDLFVHGVQGFDLKKGARASMPLRQDTIDVRHLYTVDLSTLRSRRPQQVYAQSLQADDSSEKSVLSPLKVTANPIWHQLELTNNTAVPWTSGPALIMNDVLPLGQSLLTYTPVGGKAMLPVTIAVDLRSTLEEEEISEQLNALKVDSEAYALIKKRGSITLTSYRKEKSLMRVTLSTGGKVWSASDGGAIKLGGYRAEDWDESTQIRLNHHSDVSWEYLLGPGETKTLTYEASFFLR